MRTYILFCLAAFMAVSCLKEPSLSVEKQDCVSNEPFENTHKLEKELQTLLDKALAEGIPGVTLALHSASQGSFFSTTGIADLETGTSLSPCHTFRAASLTKTLMATAFVQLQEKGVLDFETSISDILSADVVDGLAKADESTVAELLNHTSGIPNYDDNGRFVAAVLNEPGKELSTSDRLNFAKELGGTPDWVIEKFGYIYSNTNYLLLELILEQVTGTSYEDYLKEHILISAGMASSSFSTEHAYPTGLCLDYCNMYDNGRLREVTSFDAKRWSGEAALISNASDIYRFFNALLSAQLTSNEGLELMKKEHYGLLTELIDGTEAIGHDGQAIGYSSEMWYFPDKDISLVLMANQGRISSDQESIAAYERLLVDIVNLH